MQEQNAKQKIKLFEINFLVQGSEKFFGKGSDNKYFKLCGPRALCCHYSTLPLQHKSSQRQ